MLGFFSLSWTFSVELWWLYYCVLKTVNTSYHVLMIPGMLTVVIVYLVPWVHAKKSNYKIINIVKQWENIVNIVKMWECSHISSEWYFLIGLAFWKMLISHPTYFLGSQSVNWNLPSNAWYIIQKMVYNLMFLITFQKKVKNIYRHPPQLFLIVIVRIEEKKNLY